MTSKGPDDGQNSSSRLRVRCPSTETTTRVLPMRLRIGDRLTDETGEYEIIGRPYTTNGGKDAHARVQKVGQPDVTALRTWAAHERISVKRASATEGRR
jgi:hypothetical protein